MASLSILVIGLGYFGESLALELAHLGHEVVGVDTNADIVQRTAPHLNGAMELDATNIEALTSLEIASFDVCIVGRGSDLEESVLTTLNLKELGARYIICKALSDQQKKILERIGADQIVQPERDMGKRLAHMVSTTTEMLDYMDVPGNFGIEEITAPRGWLGHTLEELQLPNRHGLQVLLVKSGEKITTAPGPATKLREGDILVVFGHDRKLAQFKR
ncbi:MAG TPA: TrkA family potassium uptake protein [Armatimonadota bacterium]|nr:TrkA family potassium uptake protein [Armatimonadota bacterium]